ncbi:hypothetical protein BN990_03507 [Virgibacillus salexigens]|uniref:Uncharacterized protein n=1 Tax=Virgibacillus massiliensis TaxID=1462526 RepID=A0A024QFY7_9BACI|nr:hypothetical protein BN990_03507 [Virgibacillus massiliensis]
MLFESAKRRFRKITLSDVEQYHNWRNNLEVMEATNARLDIYAERNRLADRHCVTNSNRS